MTNQLIKLSQQVLNNVEIKGNFLVITTEDVELFPKTKNGFAYVTVDAREEEIRAENIYDVIIKNEDRGTHNLIEIAIKGKSDIYEFHNIFTVESEFNVEDREEYYEKLASLIIENLV